MSETAAWWTAIRTTAFFAAAEPAEAEPVLDPTDVPLDQWGATRSQLGLVDSANADFIGLTTDDSSGLPDWRHPVQLSEHEPTPTETYATERAAANIKTASDVFGADQPQPRRHTSSWAI
jgi:hypothetical protein